MFLSMDFDSASEFISDPELIRDDIITPAQIPECMDSTYRAGYDWLYRYEREIAGFLERWLKPYRYDLIGEKGILCEALSNAFCHGHDKDPQCSIALKVYLGEHGLLVQVVDSGPGFDVGHVLQRYFQNKHYYNTAGNGIHLMATSKQFGIFYNSQGTAFHLLYAFHCRVDALPPAQPANEIY